MPIDTPESFKARAALIRTFLKQRYDVDVSVGHSLELISQIFCFKDWNTAVAALKSETKQNSPSDEIRTVGDMKKALEAFDDSAWIDANYKFQLKDFEIEPDSNPEDVISQEFSITLKELAADLISIELELKNEDITSDYSPPINENCGFFPSHSDEL